MPTYNISVTVGAPMDKALQYELAQENARRAAATPPGTPLADVPALIVFKNGLMAQGYLDTYKRVVRDGIGEKVDTANAAQLANAAAAVGYTIP